MILFGSGSPTVKEKKTMGEVKTKKLKKKGNTKKKIFFIFGILIVGLITYGIIDVIVKQEGPISDIIGTIGEKGPPKGVAKEQIRERLVKMGYKEKRDRNLSLFSAKKGGKLYRCNIYYEKNLKGNVELSTNMSQPSANEMWGVVKDMTLNDPKFKETLILLLSLTENKIRLKDVLKRLDKNAKKNSPPTSTGIYRLRVEKRKHSLNLRANWYRGKIYLEYGVNI
jgi:hypothetical protein